MAFSLYSNLPDVVRTFQNLERTETADEDVGLLSYQMSKGKIRSSGLKAHVRNLKWFEHVVS